MFQFGKYTNILKIYIMNKCINSGNINLFSVLIVIDF